MKKYKIGYTQGVYDMFHVGHLNLINHAKEYCKYLVVGVNADDLVQEYKHRTPIFNQEERLKIVSNLKAVNESIIVNTLDKEIMLRKIGFDAIFIGDDWRGDPRWALTEEVLMKYGVDVVYLPRTEGVSSSLLRPIEKNKVEEYA